MRTKAALKNAGASLLLQVVLALSGLMLPRLFIGMYGSAVNGLVNSISQFVSYINLVEAGISASAIVALYRPLAERNTLQRNRILASTKKFYGRSGVLFAALVLLLLLVYPYVIRDEIPDTSFTRRMIGVLAVSGLADYFILGKYRVLLQADERSYVLSYAQIAGTVIMTAVSMIQMRLGCTALQVKLTAAAAYLLRTGLIVLYARCHYKDIDFRAEPDDTSAGRRWSALLHQLTALIIMNTDMLLLTVMVRREALLQVSIYSVYNLVAYACASLMNAITNGVTASFGQIMSRKDEEELERCFSIYEFVFFIVIFTVYSCMGNLLYPFIALYTSGYPDAAAYQNHGYAFLFTAIGILQSVRQPAITMICAAGHYRETQGRALTEAALKMAVSVLLAGTLGIYGVLIGSLVSFTYRSVDMIIYNHKHLVRNTGKRTGQRLLRNSAATAAVFLLLRGLPDRMLSWQSWIGCAVVTGMTSAAVIIAVNLIFERSIWETIRKRGDRT